MFDPKTLPEAIPADHREVAAALCSAVWRQEPRDNFYLTNKMFKDEWERASAFVSRLLNGEEEDLMTISENGDGPTVENLAEALCSARQGNEAVTNAYSDPANEGVFKAEYERGAKLILDWLDWQHEHGPWKIVELTADHPAGRKARTADHPAGRKARVIATGVTSKTIAGIICSSLLSRMGVADVVFMPMAQPLSSVV